MAGGSRTGGRRENEVAWPLVPAPDCPSSCHRSSCQCLGEAVRLLAEMEVLCAKNSAWNRQKFNSVCGASDKLSGQKLTCLKYVL